MFDFVIICHQIGFDREKSLVINICYIARLITLEPLTIRVNGDGVWCPGRIKGTQTQPRQTQPRQDTTQTDTTHKDTTQIKTQPRHRHNSDRTQLRQDTTQTQTQLRQDTTQTQTQPRQRHNQDRTQPIHRHCFELTQTKIYFGPKSPKRHCRV